MLNSRIESEKNQFPKIILEKWFFFLMSDYSTVHCSIFMIKNWIRSPLFIYCCFIFNFCVQASTQTDAMRVPVSRRRQMKNKSVLCRPFTMDQESMCQLPTSSAESAGNYKKHSNTFGLLSFVTPRSLSTAAAGFRCASFKWTMCHPAASWQ